MCIRDSNIEEESFTQLMMNKNQLADDIGTVLIGKQTVDTGLINAVGGLADALAKLEEIIES